MARFWNKKVCDVCVGILKKEVALADALEKISTKLGRGITRDSITNAFRAEGLQSPGSYLRSARPTLAPKAVPAKPKADVSPILFLSDVHSPYEDRKALQIVETVIKYMRPKYLISVGDFGDLHNVSRHIKDPEMKMDFGREAAGVRRTRARLDDVAYEAGVEKKVITMGNHEDRLRKYVLEHAPALEHVVPSIESLLELEENDWEVIPYGDAYRVGDLLVTHDLDRSGKYAHEQSRMEMGGSVVIGHTHRMAVTHAGTYAAGRHVAAMFGWLGDDRFAKYHKRPLRAHWQLGFGVGWLDHETNYVTVQPVPIIDYRCVVSGKVFDAPSEKARAA